MASNCSRMMIKRVSNSSFIKSAINNSNKKSTFSLPNKPTSSPITTFSFSRTPSELGCAMSLLPLHSAISSARMTSCLTTSSRSCRALSQDKIDGT